MVTIPGNPGKVARAIRSRCVQSDGYNACPSVGVLMMGATVWRLRSLFAEGHEIIGFRLLASSYSDLIRSVIWLVTGYYQPIYSTEGDLLPKHLTSLLSITCCAFSFALERNRERQRQRWRGAYYLFKPFLTPQGSVQTLTTSRPFIYHLTEAKNCWFFVQLFIFKFAICWNFTTM